MPNNRVKTSKALIAKSKGKAKDGFHENSRRAKQAVRVELREDRLKEASRQRKRFAIDKVDRLQHFAHQLDDEQPAIRLADVHALVRAYIARHDDSIAELDKERLKAKQRRPKTKSQERMELERDDEAQEYDSGFLVPDMTDAPAVKELRHWRDHHQGKAGFLPHLRLIRVLRAQPEAMVLVQEGGALPPVEHETDAMQT